MSGLTTNIATAARERRRRELRALDDPFYPVMSPTPEWDAMFGHLHDLEEGGYDVRADLGSLGRPGFSLADSPQMGRLNPFEAESQKYQAINAQSDAEAQRVRQEDESQRKQWEARQNGLINDMQTSYSNQQLAQQNAPPIVDTVQHAPAAGQSYDMRTGQTTQTPVVEKYTSRPAGDWRERMLNSVPLRMRAQLEQQLNAADTQQGKDAATLGGYIASLVKQKGGQLSPADLLQAQKDFAAAQTEGKQGPAGVTEFTADRPDPATGNTVDTRIGITPNALFQNSLNFALTGQMPSMGMGGSSGQIKNGRQAIQNQAGALAAKAGVDLPQLRAEYKANSAALSKLLPQAAATANAANTAKDNLALVLQQSPQVSRTDSKWVNEISNAFVRGATPAANLSKFETLIFTAAREYAKVTSGGALSAQALSDSAAAEASKLLNAAQSPEALKAAIEAMQNDMDNVTREQSQGLRNVSDTIANFFSAANDTPLAPAKAAKPAPGAGRGGGATVRLQAPDGTVKEVDAALAEHYIAKGAKRIQ